MRREKALRKAFRGAHHRLFLGCDNHLMLMLDSQPGRWWVRCRSAQARRERPRRNSCNSPQLEMAKGTLTIAGRNRAQKLVDATLHTQASEEPWARRPQNSSDRSSRRPISSGDVRRSGTTAPAARPLANLAQTPASSGPQSLTPAWSRLLSKPILPDDVAGCRQREHLPAGPAKLENDVHLEIHPELILALNIFSTHRRSPAAVAFASPSSDNSPPPSASTLAGASTASGPVQIQASRP